MRNWENVDVKTDNVVLNKSKSFALRIIKLYRFLNDEKREYVLSIAIPRNVTTATLTKVV